VAVSEHCVIYEQRQNLAESPALSSTKAWWGSRLILWIPSLRSF